MSADDIAETVEEFRNAAIRALKAGFDLIQIHAAHGYLLNEFLSPLTNHRTDGYGGSPENRVRIVGEVIDAVREVWPAEKPLEIRVTAEDYMEGGNHAEDLGNMINLIKNKGIDSVNVSTGDLVPVVPQTYPGYQIPQAEIIRKMTGLPVTAGGLLTDAKEVDSILADNKADLVYLGRELLRNPYWVLQAAKKLDFDLEWPKQYERAKPR
jgi:NADPH2 dehydrogenase